MTTYMDRWKGKHPAPFDFFQTWNQASGENLDWFWKAWFFEWGYPDLALQGVVNDEAAHCQVVMIEQKGNIPVPVHLQVAYTDGTKQVFHYTAAVWRSGQQNFKVACPAGKKIKSMELGAPTIPDVNQKDNKWGA